VKISRYWKATVAALAAGAGAVSTAAQDGQITGEEWTTSAIAVIAALGFTWAVPNKPPTAKDSDA
jgi:hypothetical protein